MALGITLIVRLKTVNDKVSAINSKIKVINKDLKKYRKVRKQIKEYKDRIEILKIKSEKINQIISKKKNPKSFLVRIAKNMPDDLWIDSISINSNSDLEIGGGAKTYKSIGSFISKLKSFGHKDDNLSLKESKTSIINVDNYDYKVESFTIVGNINLEI